MTLYLSAQSFSEAVAVNENPGSLSLEALANRAGLIFSGTVTKIDFPASYEDSNFVRITFHVNDGIRGARSGNEITINEWSGLWSGANQRYRVGESVFAFYHTPNMSGLSSLVGGREGRFELNNGRVNLSAMQMQSLLRSKRLREVFPQASKTPSQQTSVSLQRLARAWRLIP